MEKRRWRHVKRRDLLVRAGPRSGRMNGISLAPHRHREAFTNESKSDSWDPGLSNLFSTRIDTPCHAPDPTAFNPRKRPDRIHGLRRTKNIDILLQTQFWHDGPLRYEKVVEEVIRPISLQREDEGLLYPFLIMEAKSEKGASSFERIETQTCFPIKQALQLQQKLFKVRGDTMDIPGGPLVWFMANHGEDWRVYSAHIEGTEAQPRYVCISKLSCQNTIRTNLPLEN